MRTQLSMFDATSITIEEKRGDDEPNETIWTDITVRSNDGDVIEFTVFDCPPIQVGKNGSLCEDVLAELADLENSDLDSRDQLRADYRTEVIRSQDRYRRAVEAENACQALRDSLVFAESELSRFKKTVCGRTIFFNVSIAISTVIFFTPSTLFDIVSFVFSMASSAPFEIASFAFSIAASAIRAGPIGIELRKSSMSFGKNCHGESIFVCVTKRYCGFSSSF